MEYRKSTLNAVPNPQKNSAARILAFLLEAMQGRQDNQAAIDQWAEALGVGKGTATSAHDRDHLVAETLFLLKEEAEHMQEQLLEQDVPRDLVEPYVRRLAEDLVPTRLQQHHWGAITQHIRSAELILAFKWFIYVLPDDGDAPDSEDLASLLEAIDQLKDALNQGGVSPRIRRFVAKQVARMERALRTQPLRGAKDLREAMTAPIGDVVTEEGMLREELGGGETAETRDVMQKFRDVWEKGTKVTGQANQVFSFFKNVGNGLYAAIEYFGKQPPPT